MSVFKDDTAFPPMIENVVSSAQFPHEEVFIPLDFGVRSLRVDRTSMTVSHVERPRRGHDI